MRVSIVCLSCVFVLAACDSGPPRPDAGPDTGPAPQPDTGPPAADMGPRDAGSDTGPACTPNPDAGASGICLETDLQLPGLMAEVEVLRDTRGIPHIYARNDHDALLVQGYLMAKDRFPQMELIRRLVNGQTAEFGGSAQVPDDIDARLIGHARVAARNYASLAPTDVAKTSIDAFSEGVNIYIARLRAGTERLPPGTQLLNIILSADPPILRNWTGTDSLAIGHYQAFALSYDSGDDIELTRNRAAVTAAFPGAEGNRIFGDFWSPRPSRPSFTRMGFPNTGAGTMTGTTALNPPRRGASPRFPSMDLLLDAQHTADRLERHAQFFGDAFRGSNNWVVSGSKTQSGHPMLMNDPHLSLSSPPLFWYVHLNTSENGGDLNAMGLALSGTPGVLLGFNERVAWGLTTTGYDVTDVYEETITPGTAGAPDTVRFDPDGTASPMAPQQVAIMKVRETIDVLGDAPINIDLELVPHHGFIIPTTTQAGITPRTGTTALSVRYTGNDPSVELRTFAKMLRAGSVDDVRAAMNDFRFGSQNLVAVTRSGDIFWTSNARIPQRDSRALSYDFAANTGNAPFFVLPGNGDYEWTTDLPVANIPHDLNPARGFIATANQDNVGVTADGNPLNDGFYIGANFDPGYRHDRIRSELERLTTRGMVTVEEMQTLQGSSKSPLGAVIADDLVAAVDRASMPTVPADLQAAVTAAGAAKMTKVRALADRLRAWTTFNTPDGVEGTPTAEQIADSVAASIFNVAFTRLVPLAFEDEVARIEAQNGGRPGGGAIVRTIDRALNDPMQLNTYDATLRGGMGDTVLWDDLRTAGVVETRDDRLLRAMVAALDFLEMRLGADVAQWRWGKLHSIRFASQVPGGGADISIPVENEPAYPNGFPRQGDGFGVDAAGSPTWNTTNFTYGSGPVQRLVVDMAPDGPRAWNALPGGQSIDRRSPHHRDEAEYWRRNQAPELWFKRADVIAHAEARLRFRP